MCTHFGRGNSLTTDNRSIRGRLTCVAMARPRTSSPTGKSTRGTGPCFTGADPPTPPSNLSILFLPTCMLVRTGLCYFILRQPQCTQQSTLRGRRRQSTPSSISQQQPWPVGIRFQGTCLAWGLSKFAIISPCSCTHFYTAPFMGFVVMRLQSHKYFSLACVRPSSLPA